MPKNKGHNAFYFFMLDWKKRMEAAGRTFPNGLKDVQRDPECSEEWNNMSKQKKGTYISMQKDSKVVAQGSFEKKTTTGELMRELEEKEKQAREFKATMQKYIESVTSMGLLHNNLQKLKFIFIHVNYFTERELNTEVDHVPAEFAVTQFSLENGAEEVYHEIINEKIPLGYRNEAMDHSQDSHQIPVEFSEGQSDYSLMYDKLIDFLKTKMTGNTFPPLFTAEKVTGPTLSLLRRLCQAADQPESKFLVYSVEMLFHELRNIALRNSVLPPGESIPFTVAKDVFTKNKYFAVRNIECEFHKNIDGTAAYCSKALVKQWSFTMCDYCCKELGFPCIPGVHIPPRDWGHDNDDDDTLSCNLSRLSIQSNAKGLASMTGVTEEHRLKVSERSCAEEQRRRNECKPLEIIDHSKLNSSSSIPPPTAPIPGRPLRLPKTKSYALAGMQENSNPILDDMNFPPIGGRGIIVKKSQKEPKLPIGRGRGNAWNI